ncbi:Ankyrin repeat-containing domain,Ankyrin repeat [Cinara cedri]|uniref:Ankyrin repeat-containing domain,Ankyrin repeat n=1 Tax=Cinara cedri TaxID=506608 RepID=A0A5E4NR28_9HEMI|nr:Ankyrin repeat-containing domain,Ankyrin repeat [Cinara cedri]
MYEKLKAILGQINSDGNFDPDHVVPVVKEFLQREQKANDFDINNRFKKDDGEFTLLHVAAQNDYVKVLKALLAGGADVNAKDHKERTPLHLAAKKDDGDFTLLHIAAQNGYVKVLNALIKADADVNAKDNEEKTPLHLAALNGHTDVIKALLAGGAYAYAIDNNKKIALIYARDKGHVNAADALRSHTYSDTTPGAGKNVNGEAEYSHRVTILHQDPREGRKQRFKPIIAGAVAFCATAAFEAFILALIIAKGDFPVELFPIAIAVLVIAAVSLITGTIAYKAFEPRTQVNAVDADIANSDKGYIAE